VQDKNDILVSSTRITLIGWYRHIALKKEAMQITPLILYVSVDTPSYIFGYSVFPICDENMTVMYLIYE
jgi:hypothetical protein